MTSNTVILITGVNRGIGHGLFATYLSRPNHTVIGAVRDPASPVSQALYSLPTGANSKAIIVKIDSASDTDALAAIHSLRADHAITALDLVIANAAILNAGFPRVEHVQPSDMKAHFAVNTVGPIVLFQAVLPLLLKAAAVAGPQSPPKFVTVGSSAGSIGGMEQRPFPNAAYAPSKAAVHYLTKKIHVEHPELIALPVDPGWPRTDMGAAAASHFGFEEAELSVEESVGGIVRVLDEATREKSSGKLLRWDGVELPW